MYKRCLHWLVVQFAFQFLVVGHFANAFHEVFLHDILSFGSKIANFEVKIIATIIKIFLPNGEKASLGTNVSQVGAVKAVRQFDHRFVINFTVLCDRAGMDLEDLKSSLFIGQWNFDFTIQTTLKMHFQ